MEQTNEQKLLDRIKELEDALKSIDDNSCFSCDYMYLMVDKDIFQKAMEVRYPTVKN